jgi:hypothetical protein
VELNRTYKKKRVQLPIAGTTIGLMVIWTHLGSKIGNSGSIFRRQKNWLLHYDNALTLPFTTGNFSLKATWLTSPTHLTFLFPRLKTKLKGRHFDTIEVIDTESQGVPKTLTEHDF